jgi:phosphatidylinositol glycan class W
MEHGTIKASILSSSSFAGSSLKEEKEAFVTGHDGTTPWEILWISLAGPLGVALCQYLCRNNENKSQKVAIEAFVLWFPMILSQSNFLYPWASAILVLQILLWAYFRYVANAAMKKDSTPTATATATSTTSDSKKEEATQKPHQQRQRLDYLTAYRAIVLLMTFVAILAVDFHVFPRRFAKTETQGYGLMDLGAASFAISAGIVTPKARGRANSNKFLLHLLPLIGIGIIRIITNKSLEYQEHVSEYGVHWNFFFTMGVLAIIPRGIDHFPPSWILPTAILILYQFHLTALGFQTFIEQAPRSCDELLSTDSNGGTSSNKLCNLAFANREGILGSLGYLALFFYGEWVGAAFLWKTTGTTIVGKWSMERFGAVLWGVLALLTRVVPVSRRSTNASFCVWALAHNVTLLAILKHVVVVTTVAVTKENNKYDDRPQEPTLPLVLERLNRNGLALFLIANLLTGLVNLTIPTLDISDEWALLVLFGYISVVGLAALLLDALWSRRGRTNEGSATRTTKREKTE